MPSSMKIQPIDAGSDEHPSSEIPPPASSKPVVRSRLKRLFRISVAEKDEPHSGDNLEPSSICLAKMVQNFIEEANEKPPSVIVTGRNRCNCFNGSGSEGSDGDSDAGVREFIKSLVGCGSVNEKKVLADTARIVRDKNKVCKRKDELRKVVTQGLVSLGYDAAICKSKWDKSPSFPAGEYEYVDVIVGGERLIIDLDFKSEFEVARSTKTYKSILNIIPHIFVGKPDRLSKIICILSEASKRSLKKKGMHIPPWRKADYVQAKWLSPPTRLMSDSTTATPPLSPLDPVGSVIESSGLSPEKVVLGPDQNDEPDSSQSPPPFEPVFEMSDSSGDEEVKVKMEGI